MENVFYSSTELMAGISEAQKVPTVPLTNKAALVIKKKFAANQTFNQAAVAEAVAQLHQKRRNCAATLPQIQHPFCNEFWKINIIVSNPAKLDK